MIYRYCRDCSREMRPHATAIADWPGTVLHSGKGYCYNCRRRLKKGLPPKGTPVVEEPRPPRELDPHEVAALRLLERYGVAEEMRGMLGLDDTERPQPLTDIQMMRNSLTNPGGGTYSGRGDLEDYRSSIAHTGSVKGRRL